MKSPFIFATLLLILTIPAVDAQDAGSLWMPNDGVYKTYSIPKEWIPQKIGKRLPDAKSFEKEKDWNMAWSWKIPHFIEIFGMPDRYLVKVKLKFGQWNYLVYDFPSRETVIMYVSAPPYDSFGAAAAFGSQIGKKKGALIWLLK